MNLVQIVPRLPPAVDGLGDYSLTLARELQTHHDITSQFVIGDPSWSGDGTIDLPTQTVQQCQAEALVRHLPQQREIPVLLHYVGYGYAQRGAPYWLIQGLARWKRQHPQARLITLFHEIHAFGPPWTSAFWFSLWQRQLVIWLAQLSDRAVATSQTTASRLQDLAGQHLGEIPVLPVFSNIGEPRPVPALVERQPRLVIFGQGYSKQRIYEQRREDLQQTCDRLGIQTIWDLGPTAINCPDQIGNVPILCQGKLPQAQVSEALKTSLAGLLSYAPSRLPHSTIFAAYCAHGVLPVNLFNLDRARPSPDGIEPGELYWTPALKNPESNRLATWQAIATRAQAWYQTHNRVAQAQEFARLIHCDHSQLS